jgi:hypothetical protein
MRRNHGSIQQDSSHLASTAWYSDRFSEALHYTSFQAIKATLNLVIAALLAGGEGLRLKILGSIYGASEQGFCYGPGLFPGTGRMWRRRG